MCVVRPSRNAAGRGLGGGSSRGQCPLTSRDSFSEESPNEPRVSIRPITDEARRLFFLTPPPATPAPPHPRFRPTPRNLLTIHIIINFIYFFCPHKREDRFECFQKYRLTTPSNTTQIVIFIKCLANFPTIINIFVR